MSNKSNCQHPWDALRELSHRHFISRRLGKVDYLAECRVFPFLLTLFALTVSRGAWGQSSVSDFDSTPPSGEQSPAAAGETAAGTNLMDAGIPLRPAQLSDLTLGNFFSAGWDDDYAVRQRATGTPDLPLLRVQTNEVLRLFRTNFYEQVNLNSPTRRDLVDCDGFIDWGFNRRLMVELDGAYQWVDPRTGSDTSGGNTGILTRIKLVDTEVSACSFLFKFAAPNSALAVYDTTFTYGLTGFADLAYWLNLDRVGLYYSFVFDSQAGPAAVGAQRNDVQYDVSVAKTVTAADAPIFRKLTFFEENFAQTVLDGPTPGRTYLTITPGMRFNFGTFDGLKMGLDNAVICGVDIPISTYQPWSTTWRLSYVKCF